ncbi:MAG: translation initiation factor IF-3 [Rhodospirillales bacterium]|nr:translation initiation factor IF-3 [Alphaproteobacteria bacterium]MCB9986727.1 translation initiation factor IF-3 [Rhodospirillales bacterium]USO08591.1 MAG: translation initiation factor IF-3 [Rhodospirillales bacterium]
MLTISGECPIARPPLPPRRPPLNEDGPRVNEQIRAREVRVIDENGEMLGVMTPYDGIKRAREAGLDLIEVSPNAAPPVCKILDLGKYKYEQQKKANEARKKQKTIDIKELKLRPTIGDHDYQIKIKQARQFLTDGDKVKFTLRFRGREQSHLDLSLQVMRRAKTDLADLSKVEQDIQAEGRQAVMVLMPAPKS